MRLSIYIEDDYAQLNGYKISKDIAFEIKDLERQLAEAREDKKKIMRWMKKYLDRPNGYRSIGFSDLYEMYGQLKEKGE